MCTPPTKLPCASCSLLEPVCACTFAVQAHSTIVCACCFLCLKLVCFLPQPEGKDPEEGQSVSFVVPPSFGPTVDTPTPTPPQPSHAMPPTLPNMPAVVVQTPGIATAAAQ